MLTLKAEGIRKSYEGADALNIGYLEFRRGVYALMGANGSGKSTLLRILALLEAPDEGNLEFIENGLIVQKSLELKRRLTLVQPLGGIFNTTVWKNAEYGLSIRGVGKAEAEKKVSKILETVGLYEKKNQDALTLSSGESRRLAIARALVVRPDILFLDEPTASVDRKNSLIIEGIISFLKQGGGPIVVMATHDAGQAERLADFVIRMDAGMASEPSVWDGDL